MPTINLYEAKTQLSRLIDRAAAGEEIILARNGRPVARLTPATRPRLRYGLLANQGSISDAFNDPLPEDLQALFEGRK